MKKKYLKMNDNEENLSLGNFFRIIKELSKNKISALQTEMFCVLFEVDSINDTTVNNYCVGCRGIGGEYKQVYINKKRQYENKKEIFADNIIGILSIVDGLLYNAIDNKIEFINNNYSAYTIAKKLYNLAKNDKQVSNNLTSELHDFIEDGMIYDCLVSEMLFMILEKKQPVSEDSLKIEVLENVLNDTSISSIDLQEYLSLKLREGINFDYSMKKLAEKGNAYANYELGFNEYYGFVKGVSRYDYAYKYLKEAASLNHAGANYMIGNMLVNKIIGSGSNDELEKGYKYLLKSQELGNVAALNTIGNMLLNGIYPLEKNENMAISYYEKAANNNYVFAYNNLGKIKERQGNYNEALEFYLKSADLGESWACNKVGEYYRQGKVEKDMRKAFYYYNKAIESNYRTLCYYAYYNLAVYFYKNGYDDIVINADINKYECYLIEAGNNGIIEALIELFYYYISQYLKTRSDVYFDKVYDIKLQIEKNPKFNQNMRFKIENKINEIKNNKGISLGTIDLM